MTLKIQLAYLLILVQDVMSNSALLAGSFHTQFAQVENDDDARKRGIWMLVGERSERAGAMVLTKAMKLAGDSRCSCCLLWQLSCRCQLFSTEASKEQDSWKKCLGLSTGEASGSHTQGSNQCPQLSTLTFLN